jgi:threonine aldolase
MNFTSDNTHIIAKPILNAIMKANKSSVASYGGDEITKKAKEKICDLFDIEAEIFFVTSGTAANALSISSITPPYGSVFCHNESHIHLEECGAPEFFSGGCKLIPIQGFAGKISSESFQDAINDHPSDRFDLIPSCLSVTQSTECGTIYNEKEISDLTSIAHKNNIKVHMDGARFANAISTLKINPSELTWKAGIDIMSFGSTKNGTMSAESIIVFNKKISDDINLRIKRSGHLLSKMRFLSIQMDSYVTDNLWIDLANKANEMAQYMYKKLSEVNNIKVPWKVQSNEVFVILPKRIEQELSKRNIKYHKWSKVGISNIIDKDNEEFIRLVMSFNTKKNEIDELIKNINSII